MTRTARLAATAISLGFLAACGSSEPPPEAEIAVDTPPAISTIAPAPTLDDIIAGTQRSDDAKARDVFRNPAATLDFFEVETDDTVIEIWPGGGWYTSILAPYLKDEGRYIAAGFDTEGSDFAKRAMANFTTNFVERSDIFGEITVSTLSGNSGPLAEPESADVVLTFRNVHNWMAMETTDKVFDDMFAALKPGGTLGVVEHRLPSAEPQDPRAASGYVHEDFVKQVAARAGFEFVEASEINANPKDTADHPFGVWTLPPSSRTSTNQIETPEDFDPAVYLAIGESDRMTLKFIKPVPEEVIETPSE